MAIAASGLRADNECAGSAGCQAARRTGILALVPDAYRQPWSTRHHVVTRLAQYFPVVWVEPSIEWREHWLPSSRAGACVGPVQAPLGLQVLAPNRLLPQLHRRGWLRQAVRRARFNAGRDLLLRQGVERIALYIWRPEFADALELVQHDFSCYHIDDEYSFSRTDRGNSPEEVALISSVDQVIVHSRRLMAKKGAINPRTALIPNGVDYAAYSTPHPEPPDLACIQSPRIGYVGVIKTQLDLDLLFRLARRLPHASFVFVGPIGFLGEKKATWSRLTALHNVHVLGHRDVSMLPAYTQHLDVCVMCYEITDYTNAIFPLKLNEYLAAGRPVISSRIDSVLPFFDVVRLAKSEDDWVRAIEVALSSQAQADVLREARRGVAREHDWDLLVAKIVDLFRTDTATTSVGRES